MGNRKKYAAIFSCLVLVVALGAGIAGSRSARKESDKQQALNEAAILNAEKNAQRVDVNKNANPDGIKYNDSKENGSVKDYYDGQDKKSNDPADNPDAGKKNGTETSQGAEKTDGNTDKNAPAKSGGENQSASAEDMDGEEFVLADTPEAKPVFSWPLEGDFVMDFSSDAVLYDATLDQYRTNDCICISAAKGSPVKAAAAGTVESVAHNDEDGYTVTIFHGNGWRTTYGQLDENVAVSQGDIVNAGDLLGTVADPSKYSAALGDHLSFAVLEEEAAIDPKVALAE